MVILVSKREVFGRVLYYPECAAANKVTRLTGKKTLDTHDFNLLKGLGHEIKLKQEELTL